MKSTQTQSSAAVTPWGDTCNDCAEQMCSIMKGRDGISRCVLCHIKLEEATK
jgi:hypothetical protein